jgi:large subunit ribosomal protein L23
MDTQDIIIAPIISEKSMKDAKSNKFTFKVLMQANKKMIKIAIEDKFKVDVLDIKTAIVKGKKTRAGKRRIEILHSPWKKAVAKVAPGQKISIFDIGEK